MLGDTNTGNIDQVVANPDGFYPDINLGTWQERYRVPGTAPQTLQSRLVLAMRTCNERLADWRAEQEADGVTELPAARVEFYTEAVMAYAFALLIPLLPGVVTDERARAEMEQLDQRPGAHFAAATHWLARVRGDAGSGRVNAAVI